MNELEDDKYISIGYDRYKLKGKEDDENADVFVKTDAGQYVKSDDQNSIESSKSRNYPALIFLSKFANFIAWLGVISSLVGYYIYIDSLYRPELDEVLFPLFAIILATFILFVFWRAISEILILFVDIAKDVREISLKK